MAKQAAEQSTSTTNHGDDLAAASARVAARRERRASIAADLAAADDLRRMAARMGEDAIASAALAALTRASSGGATAADVVTAAWAGAREARKDAARSAAARAEREAHFATGRMVTREDAADLAARVAGQHGDGPDDLAAVWSCEVVRAATAAERGDLAAMRERLGEMVAIVGGAPIGWTSTAGAVAGAIAADGPTTKSDHDPAGCHLATCRKCRRMREQSGMEVGTLARVTKDGHKRPAARDRAPREVTTATRVAIQRESSLARMLDRISHHGGNDTAAESTPPPCDGRPAAVTLADLSIVTTAGRRGVAVGWTETALHYGMRAADLAAWRATTAGHVMAWAIESGRLTADDMVRAARAADMSAADLATATTAATC